MIRELAWGVGRAVAQSVVVLAVITLAAAAVKSPGLVLPYLSFALSIAALAVAVAALRRSR